MPQAGRPPPSDTRAFDDRDRVYALLRAVALCAGLAYAYLSPEGRSRHIAVLSAHAAFLGYSLLAYAVGWQLVRLADKSRFYLALAITDLGFVVVLMALTGGPASPYYRALYVWIAMIAFYWGRRGGLAASLTALAVYVVFHAHTDLSTDLWITLVQGGGMLMHGPLIGVLTDRERRRAADLRQAHDRLAATNQRLVEEQAKVVQAEKLSSIGLLAAGVAHEINNPLLGVLACVKALRQDALSETRREEYFETARDGLERIRQTVRSLLDYARQSPPSIETLDAAEIAEGCVRLLSPRLRKQQVEVEIRVKAGQVTLSADRSQLMQVLMNLLLNAADASSPGDHIVIEASTRNGWTLLTVVDEGAGIAAEDLTRVCDPFFTTKPEGEGTGLGLSVSLGIVRAHGGDLDFRSAPGQGTTVTVRLPGERTHDARDPARG